MYSLNIVFLALTFYHVGRSLCLPACEPPVNDLPVVDLGYASHQALSYDTTAGFYKFQNIRYARPPLGDLRFRAPLPPTDNRDMVLNGSETRICPSGMTDWEARGGAALEPFLGSKPFDLQAWEAAMANAFLLPKSNTSDLSVATTEDCLFLDVYVPTRVLKQAEQNQKGAKGAPVLVWIHGGGYIAGSKDGAPPYPYDPSGLLKQSEEEMIFVAINYRLGAFGWLAGNEVRKDGDENAGLLDQRLALNWVQDKIHLFGGDAARVTVMGESAGAGSIMLHITAFGGTKGKGKRTPFTQAIAQSVAISSLSNSSFEDFLTQANVTSLQEARKLPSKALIDANTRQLALAPSNAFLWSPVVDGSYIPAPPAKLLASGAFDKSIKVLVGRNSFEGGSFFDPTVKDEAGFLRWVQTSYPRLSATNQAALASLIYPPQFDGSEGYIDQDTRMMAAAADGGLDCNGLALNQAFASNGYGYEFAVFPGLHGQDLGYTFDSPFASSFPGFSSGAKATLQHLVTSFVLTGTPMLINGTAVPHWGQSQSLLNITDNRDYASTVSTNQTRCAWWWEVMN